MNGMHWAVVASAVLLAGCAAPAKEARPPLQDLEGALARGPEERPRDYAFLGLKLSPIGRRFAGMRVTEVLRGGPSGRNGLKAGEVLLAIDGRTVETEEQALDFVRALPPGVEVKLTLLSGGVQRALPVRAGFAMKQKRELGHALQERRLLEQILPPAVFEMMAEMHEREAALVQKYVDDGLPEAEARTRVRKELQEDLDRVQKAIDREFKPGRGTLIPPEELEREVETWL